jgi:hypothetical protein
VKEFLYKMMVPVTARGHCPPQADSVVLSDRGGGKIEGMVVIKGL